MGEEVGVFVGLCSQDWQLIAQHHRPGPYTGTGCHGPSIVANRLSYVLGLRGASLVVDTACSSSLVAASAALDNLHRADMGAALVAGVNLCLTHHMFVAFSCARMLSPTGRNATFDASCDGYVRDRSCFAAGVTIEDDVALVARYESGATLSYHLNAFAPWEGLRVAFNGTRGRLDYEVVEASCERGAKESNLRAALASPLALALL